MLLAKTTVSEEEAGYNGVYSAVLGIIREEDGYTGLVDATDKVLDLAAQYFKNPLYNPTALPDMVLTAQSRHNRLQEYCQTVARKISGVQVEPGNVLASKVSNRKVLVAHGGSDLEKVPRVKGSWRMIEKSMLRPGSPQVVGAAGPSVAQILDASRSTILFQNCHAMRQALDMISSSASPVLVCKGKNRLRTPSAGGWADILLNLIWKDDPEQHVMEVQFYHIKLMMIRQSDAFSGHHAYDRYRSAAEIIEYVEELAMQAEAL